jgi:hypothetical protein
MMMLTESTLASIAASMSFLTLLVALQISASSLALAISLTASFSPAETAANPASMTLTPRASMALAMVSFFSFVRETPGVCSPSRSVVSKIVTDLGFSPNKTIPHYFTLT